MTQERALYLLKTIALLLHPLFIMTYMMKTIKLRKISYAQAKKEIEEYFEKHHGENLDAADIQEKLRISIVEAIGILAVLEFEGEISDTGNAGRRYKIISEKEK